MLFAFKKVFSNIIYLIVAVIIALIVFSLLILLPNLELLERVAASSSTTFFDFLLITIGLIFSSTESFSALSIFYIMSISLLFGINIMMIAYRIKISKKLPQTKETIASVGGMTGGVFGAGCVACGSILLSPVLSLLGVSTVVTFFPFGGLEFGILGIIALSFSILIIAKKINKGNIC